MDRHSFSGCCFSLLCGLKSEILHRRHWSNNDGDRCLLLADGSCNLHEGLVFFVNKCSCLKFYSLPLKKKIVHLSRRMFKLLSCQTDQISQYSWTNTSRCLHDCTRVGSAAMRKFWDGMIDDAWYIWNYPSSFTVFQHGKLRHVLLWKSFHPSCSPLGSLIWGLDILQSWAYHAGRRHRCSVGHSHTLLMITCTSHRVKLETVSCWY